MMALYYKADPCPGFADEYSLANVFEYLYLKFKNVEDPRTPLSNVENFWEKYDKTVLERGAIFPLEKSKVENERVLAVIKCVQQANTWSECLEITQQNPHISNQKLPIMDEDEEEDFIDWEEFGSDDE